MAQPLIVQSGLTLALSMALAAYVALLRPRTSLHHLVLAILGAIVSWTAGTIVVYASGGQPPAARLGVVILYLGILLSPPLWLFLCARLARAGFAIDRPTAALVGLLSPSAVALLMVATDSRHGFFASGESLAIFTEPVSRWAGPVFWVICIWSYLCTTAGVALCASAARRTAGPTERRRLQLVGLAAAVPLLTIGLALLEWVPPSVHLTPADLGISAALLVTAVVRYRFLEPSPLPAREVISHLRDGLVLADAESVVVDASPSAVKLLGRPLEALRGRHLQTVLDLLTPVDHPPPLVFEGASDVAAIRTLVTADRRVVDVSAGRVSDASGRASGSFLVLRDRTEQHREERRRHQSQRLASLGVIAAGIAHEINNPLAFVRTNLTQLERLVELVLKHASGFEPEEAEEISELEEVLNEARAGVDRIAAIVEATRRLSREPGRERAPVDVNGAVELAVQLAGVQRPPGVSVQTDLDPGLPEVLGSTEQLGQVLLNLLINAVQAVRERPSGYVLLETRAGDGCVELRVHDDGPGVPVRLRERIFDPFFTTKPPDEGTGLGLAIAHEIAIAHDGTLDVTTSRLGGACFTLRLPAASGGAAAPLPPPAGG